MNTYTSTIDAATAIAINLFEINHIAVDNDSVRRCVTSWYNHSDVTNPNILAACALEGKDWSPTATYQDMLNANARWF